MSASQIKEFDRKMNSEFEKNAGFSVKELFQKVGNKYWAIALVVCYLPRFFYLVKLILFIQMDSFAQSTNPARLTIVMALNALLVSLAMSAVIPTIVGVVVYLNAEIYGQPIGNNIIGLVFALWWRSTYVAWANCIPPQP